MDAAWSVKTSAVVPLSHVCESHIRLAAPSPGRGSKVVFHLAAIKHIIAGLMANREESQMISQRLLLQFQEERTTGANKPATAARGRGVTDLWSHLMSQEWLSALLYLFLDVVS